MKELTTLSIALIMAISLNAQQTGTFKDSRDGKTYTTIEIGSQTWFAENLNYETSNSWWYNSSSANGNIYGRLYTWAAAMNGESSSNSVPSGVQGICPDGWHLPSDAEWSVLTDYLGGEDVAGGKMKEVGTAHWYSPNTGATNSSGFTALPGGYRNSNGSFYDLGRSGDWWSATETISTAAWRRSLDYSNGNVYRYSASKVGGFSVRCVRD
ncbi:MAG: fibrobacter succinogenes major paralogous domain-containing protein [Bacteroidetes bacterium]|nr:fibrobacter succinogenes major paralogous domain-containing protein [Bacteroidota bacterium]MBU1579395.1 fibrobacter succinogenes major paralogous domain-containing protein [Bacteroidota bacterium]MBU2465785.1 fibrobacter succinogenes major paralogous domain-containing protein [Bacteroidota bacterium]MBU2558496.1 fibrobacter succinogenes major paralogous domain-containing protein [Bacteroidota bacterium]